MKRKQIKMKVVTKQNEGKSIDLVVSPIDIGINFSGTIMPELLFSKSHKTDRKFFLYGFICTPLILGEGGIAETT